MKVENSNPKQTASEEATGQSLLMSFKSEPWGAAPNQFRTTQTTRTIKPTAMYISGSRMNTEPTQSLVPTIIAVTPAASHPSRHL